MNRVKTLILMDTAIVFMMVGAGIITALRGDPILGCVCSGIAYLVSAGGYHHERSTTE